MTKVFCAQGQYGREIRVTMEKVTCFECREIKTCLLFDSSEEEYSTMKFCQNCLDYFFEGHTSKSTWKNDLGEE
jgi:hypothetical protein